MASKSTLLSFLFAILSYWPIFVIAQTNEGAIFRAKNFLLNIDNSVQHIDLLGLYSSTRPPEVSDRDMEEIINNAVTLTNEIFRNSGVHIRINLLDVLEIDTGESSISFFDLADQYRYAEPPFLEVQQQRYKIGADLVALFHYSLNDYDPCGYAFFGVQYNLLFPENMISIVDPNCDERVLAHEIGHNMGLGHASGERSNFSYGVGYLDLENEFYTVMSPGYVNTEESLLFSSPYLNCKDKPCGIGNEDYSNSANAVLALNRVRYAVAGLVSENTELPEFEREPTIITYFDVDTLISYLQDENWRSCLTPLLDALTSEIYEITCADRGIVSVESAASFRNIRHLDLSNNNLNQLEYLGELPFLEELYLNGNPIGDLNSIKNLRGLEVLDLSNTAISDLLIVSSFKRLKLLDISFTEVPSLLPLIYSSDYFHFVNFDGLTTIPCWQLDYLSRFNQVGIMVSPQTCDPQFDSDDEDGDGISNAEEISLLLNPIVADTQGSGNTVDTDNDGIYDIDDIDDDNDKILDRFDYSPGQDWTPACYYSNFFISDGCPIKRDTDDDGIPDLEDADDDNDGFIDEAEEFPLDEARQFDSDGDGIDDNNDADDDNDGVFDMNDYASLNPFISDAPDVKNESSRDRRKNSSGELDIYSLIVALLLIFGRRTGIDKSE